MRSAIKKSFPDLPILGCFYHYIKAIFTKCKKLGLVTENYFLETNKILLFFKIYPFIFEEEQTELIQYIIEKFINLKDVILKKKIYNKYIDYVNKDYTPIQKLEAQYNNLFKVVYNNIIPRIIEICKAINELNENLNTKLHPHNIKYTIEKILEKKKDALNNINNNKEEYEIIRKDELNVPLKDLDDIGKDIVNRTNFLFFHIMSRQ